MTNSNLTKATRTDARTTTRPLLRTRLTKNNNRHVSNLRRELKATNMGVAMFCVRNINGGTHLPVKTINDRRHRPTARIFGLLLMRGFIFNIRTRRRQRLFTLLARRANRRMRKQRTRTATRRRKLVPHLKRVMTIAGANRRIRYLTKNRNHRLYNTLTRCLMRRNRNIPRAITRKGKTTRVRTVRLSISGLTKTNSNNNVSHRRRTMRTNNRKNVFFGHGRSLFRGTPHGKNCLHISNKGNINNLLRRIRCSTRNVRKKRRNSAVLRHTTTSNRAILVISAKRSNTNISRVNRVTHPSKVRGFLITLTSFTLSANTRTVLPRMINNTSNNLSIRTRVMRPLSRKRHLFLILINRNSGRNTVVLRIRAKNFRHLVRNTIRLIIMASNFANELRFKK